MPSTTADILNRSVSSPVELIAKSMQDEAASRKCNFLLLRLGTSLVSGAILSAVVGNEVFQLAVFAIMTFLGCYCFINWFRLDAVQCNYTPWRSCGIKLGVFAIVTIPYYFISTRGLVRGIAFVLATVIFLVTDFCLLFLGMETVEAGISYFR